jgi:uncharacterized membrane protein (DUF485 family)
MLANPTFRELVHARSRLAWTLTAIMLVVYFGFILLVAFNKSDGAILSTKVGGGTTSYAIVFGLILLVLTFVITAIYVAIANAKFDRLNAALRQEVGQ